jgi:uncharacterized membrane protein YdjX (TVP38/TMEM64 family)
MTPERRSRALRVAGVIAFLLFPYALLRVPVVRAWAGWLIACIRSGGLAGAVALVGFDVGWSFISAPFWIMGAVAGYAYGFPLGVVFALPADTFAMCLVFVVARRVLARFVKPSAIASARVAAVRRAVATDGRKITMLLRMTPLLPQNVLTYVLATTELRLRDLVLATACGLLPHTVFYVYAGSLVDDVAALLAGDTPDVGPLRWFLLGGGLVVGAVALFVIARIARGALRRALEQAEGDGGV